MKYKLVLSIFLAFMALVFILQNDTRIEVKYLAWSVEMPQVALMVIMLAVGMLISWLFGGYLRFRRKKENQLSE